MRFIDSLRIMLVAVFAAGMIGCSGAYVANIAGDKITVDDFEYIFAKNNGGWEAASKMSLDEKKHFLDLYIKFRLKVKDAYAKGYDKDPELQRELAEYRKNLAVSYMLEQEITKPAIEQMYQRRLKEVRASHILIRLPENPSPDDTAKAYAKAAAIIDSLKKGISFAALADNNSEDPSVRNNHGDLYYFTAGAMVPQFEDAVFSLKTGEYSSVPVRTQFGYHVLKVTDIQPNQGSVRVSHIMKRLPPNPSAEDSTKAAQELLAIRDSILAGKDFAEFARNISDDTFSGQRGGDLGFIDRGRTVREFDQAIFALKDGELSGIVKTQFGLHLVKRHETQGVKPFKELEQQLKSQYQSYRFQYDYDNMIAKIKALYKFTSNPSIASVISTKADSTAKFSDEKWDSVLTASEKKQTVFSYAGKNITLDSVITLAKTNPDLQGMIIKRPENVATMLDKIGANLVAEHYAEQLESKFPDFARTMKEYEEGILLFKAEQENVWNQVVLTDSALKAFHAQRSANYTFPDRVNFQEIYVPTDSVAKLVVKAMTGYTRDSLVARKTKTKTRKPLYDTLKIKVAPVSFDSAAVLFNKRTSTADARGVWGLQNVTTNGLTQRAWKSEPKDSLTYAPYETGFSFIKVLQKDPAREKTFEEAQSEVSGAYQEYETKRLGDEWYESLKKKYPVTLSIDGLKITFTKTPPAAAQQSH